MPWITVEPMDQKILFIGDYLRGEQAISRLCERYGVSRKTGYKWIARYQADGCDGLEERSRKPQHHPAQTPYAVRKRIIELRTQMRLTPGAKKIRAKLAQELDAPPAVSTINKILSQEGLSERRASPRRYDRYPHKLARALLPNDIWSVDFKGQFKLGNDQWCYPLTLMDDVSRYLLTVKALDSTKGAGTKAAFTRAFQSYGLPRMIRSDNGTPFASRSTAGLSSLSVWWIRLGIYPERIEPGKPQQNGKHERMHRTLKRHTTRPAANTMASQQSSFDDFIDAYNHERPHEALEMQLPADVYGSSPRPFPETLPDIEYPDYFRVKRVTHSGIIYWDNGRGYISHLLKNQWVGLDEVDDGVLDVYFSFYKLGRIDTTKPYKGNRDYWSVNV